MPGSKLAREIVGLADGLAESPPETRLRLLMRARRAAGTQAQHRVFDEDGFIARLDFAYPELKLAIEYDGQWHADRAARQGPRSAEPPVDGGLAGRLRDGGRHARP